MKQLLILLATTSACGGGSSAKPTAPATQDPIPMVEHAAAQPPARPTTPEEPETADPAQVKADLRAAETTAFEKAKPVFEANCARCHSKAGKSATEKKRGHFDMTTYPFGGHHAMEIAKEIRKALGLTGGKPTMPYDKKGSVTGNDLAAIAAWADAFDAAHAGGAHDGHGEHGGEHKH